MNRELNTTFIMALQALILKMGYKSGPVDGIYGPELRKTIAQFQKNKGLPPTGEVNDETYQALMSYLIGYDIYTIRQGDSLYDIANGYGTTINRIVTANEGINPYHLMVGEQITVPYNFNLVDTNINYTYNVLENDIKGLQARYPFLEVGSIGESVAGRNLYYIRLGEGENKVLYNAAHHSLEWITTPVLMKFIENFLINYTEGKKMQEYDLDSIWNRTSIYIVPMVNPDGIDLVLNGVSEDNPYYKELMVWNHDSRDFSSIWQANIRGVDLNHNYPALWEKSKEAEEMLGIFGPGSTRYSGEAPLTEPECIAMVDFTNRMDPGLILDYHSQGEVIFWDFQNMASDEALKIGERLAEISGYELAEAHGITSYAGYKDWFIKDYGRPGYTIEIGQGINPLPIAQFDEIYANNEIVLLEAAIIKL